MAKSTPTLKYPDRKISDTFLQFAEPFLNAVTSNVTEAQVEQMLMTVWTVWNSVVYADVANRNEMLEKLRHAVRHNPQLSGLIEGLIQRKRALFADDERIIGEYKLYRKDGGIRLRAEARNPRTKVQ